MSNKVIAIFLAASAAVAGMGLNATEATANNSVFNRYENRNIYNGSSHTEVNSKVDSISKTITDSTSIKVEAVADLGDTNVANVNFDGTNFKANAHSSNRRPVDPQAVIYYTEVNQQDINTTREWTNVSILEKYNFSGNEREHEVGNRFN